jgi:hypothetical protein
MSASPERPAQPVRHITDRPSGKGGEQVLDLIAGQPDQPGRGGVAGAFGTGGDHQEGMGKHGEGGPAVPAAPAADLVLVQPDQALAGLQALLDGPAPAHDPDQDGQRSGAGGVAAVEGQLAGGVVAADHQPVPARLVARCQALVVQAHKRPVVHAVTLGARATRHLLPCPRRNVPEQGIGAAGGAAEPHRVVAGDR